MVNLIKELQAQNDSVEVYNTLLQIIVLLADPQYFWVEGARATGKTSEILPARMDRVIHSMPQATSLFANSTFISLYEDILPTLFSYYNKYYIKGIHWEFGKKPPAHFKQPIDEVLSWKNVFSMYNGHVCYMTSTDRGAPSIGKNAVHVFIDEALRIDEHKATERIFFTLRQDRTKWGESPYYAGISGFSSSPNMQIDHTWWLKYEEKMNIEEIKKIIYVAIRFYQNNGKLAYYMQKNTKTGLNDKEYTELNAAIKFKKKWQRYLDIKRKGLTLFARTSIMSNLVNVGLEFLSNAFEFSTDMQTLHTSVFNVRQKNVKNQFFFKFANRHIFDDSYKYDRLEKLLEDINVERLPAHDCSELKYLNPKEPLRISMDPGSFWSIIIAQRQKDLYRVLKNFYVYAPNSYPELVKDFADFFHKHPTKRYILDSDRAGNQKKKNTNNNTDNSDVDKFIEEMRKYGWTCQKYRSANAPNLTHKEQYLLLAVLFGEYDNTLDKIIIDRNECSELIDSINCTPAKFDNGKVEIDKKNENPKVVPFEKQASNSPQIATALIYGLAGEYQTILKNKPSYTDWDSIVFA